MTTQTPQTGSQAVERASALLGVIVESGAPRTFTSLVDELGLAKSTTSRLLSALERARLVHRDRSGAFRPGALFSLHAARPSALHDLSELARPTMEHLSELSGETVVLAVPRGGQVVQIDQVDSRYMLGAVNWVGVDVPAHCTALGKVLYAFDALPRPQGALERRTPHSPVDRAQLDHMLVEVRRRGFAVSSGSSCTSSTLDPSHVLVAMGVLSHGNVRVSLHRETTESDVDRFLAELPGIVAELRAQAGVTDL